MALLPSQGTRAIVRGCEAEADTERGEHPSGDPEPFTRGDFSIDNPCFHSDNFQLGTNQLSIPCLFLQMFQLPTQQTLHPLTLEEDHLNKFCETQQSYKILKETEDRKTHTCANSVNCGSSAVFALFFVNFVNFSEV